MNPIQQLDLDAGRRLRVNSGGATRLYLIDGYSKEVGGDEGEVLTISMTQVPEPRPEPPRFYIGECVRVSHRTLISEARGQGATVLSYYEAVKTPEPMVVVLLDDGRERVISERHLAPVSDLFRVVTLPYTVAHSSLAEPA